LAEDLEEFIEGTSSSGGIDFETREEDELYPDAYDVVIKS